MDESDDAQPELKKFEGGLPYMFVGPRVTPRRQRAIPRVLTVVMVVIMIALLLGVLFAVVNLTRLSPNPLLRRGHPAGGDGARDLGRRQPRPGLRRRPLDAGGGHVQIRAVGPWMPLRHFPSATPLRPLLRFLSSYSGG